mmetsp:Transcript_108726/g.188784  ORF Transcript_108726/g.188784 Transcript_108726/m.188784 type:complete len:274 (+) Transcript_108726:26-847(+)
MRSAASPSAKLARSPLKVSSSARSSARSFPSAPSASTTPLACSCSISSHIVRTPFMSSACFVLAASNARTKPCVRFSISFTTPRPRVMAVLSSARSEASLPSKCSNLAAVAVATFLMNCSMPSHLSARSLMSPRSPSLRFASTAGVSARLIPRTSFKSIAICANLCSIETNRISYCSCQAVWSRRISMTDACCIIMSRRSSAKAVSDTTPAAPAAAPTNPGPPPRFEEDRIGCMLCRERSASRSRRRRAKPPSTSSRAAAASLRNSAITAAEL